MGKKSGGFSLVDFACSATYRIYINLYHTLSFNKDIISIKISFCKFLQILYFLICISKLFIRSLLVTRVRHERLSHKF